MSDSLRKYARWVGPAVVMLIGLLVMVAAAGCGPAPTPIAPVFPTPTQYAPPTVEPTPTTPPRPTPVPLSFPLPAPATAGDGGVKADDSNCRACHTDEARLRELAKESEKGPNLSEGEGWGGEVPQVEAWQKVFINSEQFSASLHDRFGCITCHGGKSGVASMEAHEGVVREPDSQKACAPCHREIVTTDATSLHSTLAGYRTALYTRSTPDKYPQIDQMMANHCNKCHTSCGQCHVSMPTNLDGGLLQGHDFKKIPPMNLTCTGCHGSRINDEYKGENEGVPADVHWQKAGMPCFRCHSRDQMHGALGEKKHRYDGPPTPDCRECHSDVKPGDGITQHTEKHLELLACSVCHATTYKNCYSCHVAQQDGIPYYKIAKTEMNFKIGLNPLRSPERPWKYVVLRHVPIAPDDYEYYGQDLLRNYDALPTWKYATPHNIQRVTPQNQSCTNCHGNPDVFLTEKDLLPYEVKANGGVIVKEIPGF